MCVSVPGIVLWPIHCSADGHQSLCSGFEVGTSEGHAFPLLPGRLADRSGIERSFASTSGLTSSVVQRSGDCGQLGEVGPPAVYLSSVSRHADRHVSRAGVSIISMSGSIPRSGDVFSAASITSSSNVAAAAGPNGITGMFTSKGSQLHASPPVAFQEPLVSSG